MKGFRGFAPGQEQIRLPDSFFTELLPLIDDLSELKVALACWRAWTLQSGPLRWDEVRADPALADLDDAALRDGLERAVARGTLLRVCVDDQEWFLTNTEEGRAAATAIQTGQPPLALKTTAPPRPNIFALYEQTIGLLSPLIADELRDAEASYPPSWIEEAFREAARQNVHSWAYVHKILQRRARRSKRARRDGSVSNEWERFIRGES